MLKEGIRYGDPKARTMLIRITGEKEAAFLQTEYEQICSLSGRKDFCLYAFCVTDWNTDLSPWKAPAVFGTDPFGGAAQKTLEELLTRIDPIREAASSKAKLYLGGYSLAGLFSLWAVTKTKAFEGVAAASPSVWFPGFTAYLQDSAVEAVFAYLSLGDKEEKTRNPVMRTVGDAIRRTQEILTDQFVVNTLEWNPGNHFKDTSLRMAKGFSWLLEQKEIDAIEAASRIRANRGTSAVDML